MTLVLAVVFTAVYASNRSKIEEVDFAELSASNSLQLSSALSVTIVSSPWAALDSNKPDLEGPSVFIVEARVTNLGPDPATNIEVTVDYNDEDAGWTLLEGEDPTRKVDSLGVGVDEAFYAYWFAQYPRVIGESHQYTVTAKADGVAAVSTSTNTFDDNLLAQGTTAQTKPYLSTGNTGIIFVSSPAFVGVIFTATIAYDLGTAPQAIQFSPVGNLDFDAHSSQLLTTKVRFYNGSGNGEVIIDDQLYFPTVPQVGGKTAEMAEVDYIFLPQRPATVRMCPYAGVEFQTQSKYDKDYCDDPVGTIINIDLELSFSMAIEASASTVLQNDTLTYTIHYTNGGADDIGMAWIWDQVDEGLVTIITDTIDPPNDANESSDGLIAWSIGAVPALPDPSSSGAVTFTVMVDGQGVDLADGTEVVNYAFFGVNRDALPRDPALTSTFTTTVLAPQVEITKSDGMVSVEAGALVTYTLIAKNSGSSAANSLVLTDVLPNGVIYQGGATGNPSVNGQTLVWDGLESLAPNSDPLKIDVPVMVRLVADGTVLTNTVYARFTNGAGYQYQEQVATDITTVLAPDLSINKSASPNPVLSGATLTYTLVYSNSGLVTATNAVITDVVPLSTTYQSCTGGDTCYLEDDTVTWELSSIPAQSGSSVGFAVQVDNGLDDGTILVNDSYGLSSAQSSFIGGKPVNTLVLRNAGFVEGHTFEDANGNGSLDPGETGISNVDISLAEATDPEQASDANGYYRFRVEDEQWVSVTASLPDDYFRTSPETVWIENSFQLTRTVDFGYAASSSPFGAIYGTVFEDLDGDGVQEAGEAGLEGVLLRVNSGLTTTTDAFGRYSFVVSSAGVHTLVETDPDGYFSTTPNEVHVSIDLGETVEVNFGDAKKSSAFASVVGTVFEDLNSDGQWDDNEVGISNVTVNFDNSSTDTGKFGGYSFKASNPGSFEVVEVDPVGYFSTTPNEVEVNIILGNSYQVDFGDVPVENAQCSGDEYEPDDKLEDANNLSIGEIQKHNFCDNPLDWVKFEATHGFIYTMRTSSWGQRADTVITLYDANGKRLGGNDDVEGSDDFSSKYVWEAKTGGVHYLRVTNRAGLTGFHTDYDLTLQVEENYYFFLPIGYKDSGPASNKTHMTKPGIRPESPVEPAGVINHSCADDYEIDDTWQLARPVEPGIKQDRSFDSNPFVYAADKDYLWFELNRFEVFTFTIESLVNTSTVMELYDSYGDALGVTDGQQIVWSEAPPGRYYLSVSPGPGNTNYGCTDEAGYTLLVRSKSGYSLFLSVVSSSN
jgi:uncharacterized repeat protein (TIGR01451 family)